MGGFLKRVTIPEDFANRVVNIHPALVPAFCGEGFYGHRVHEAVLEYGAKLSGCTVHFADNQYDHGPVILQRAVPVLDDDTPETLAARVFEAECEAYPEAIRLIAAGRVAVEGRRVRIRPESLVCHCLEQAVPGQVAWPALLVPSSGTPRHARSRSSNSNSATSIATEL